MRMWTHLIVLPRWIQ